MSIHLITQIVEVISFGHDSVFDSGAITASTMHHHDQRLSMPSESLDDESEALLLLRSEVDTVNVRLSRSSRSS
jgi:hypothetical protein